MNLTSSGLLSSARQDSVNRQLTNMSKSGLTYDQTSKAKISNHETDKQAEDNATWFFEYRALLNSKLTTLTTALTSAYTTDLDSAMGLNTSTGTTAFAGAAGWGNKTAMQGRTGAPVGALGSAVDIDPGAARTGFAYLLGFFNTPTASFPTTPAPNDWKGDTNTSANTQANGNVSNLLTGTSTFISSGTVFDLDKLKIDLKNTGVTRNAGGTVVTGVGATGNKYTNDKDLSFERDILDRRNSADGQTDFQKIGNNFEMTLFKFFAKPENFDILKFGLFENLYVVGTSSLATGSQVQGSVSLNWNINTGNIDIKQERFAAFFHS